MNNPSYISLNDRAENGNSSVISSPNTIVPQKDYKHTTIAEAQTKKTDRRELLRMIEWLKANNLPALPVAPLQDAKRYPATTRTGELKHDKDGNLEPKYNGKNPSYLDKKGVPHTIDWKDYRKRLPTEEEINEWFADPRNGIGTLAINDLKFYDLDVKQYDYNIPECEKAHQAFMERNPQLSDTFQARTHSGGYRVIFKVKEECNFRPFSLEPGGKHVGELVEFTVLPPTIGISGNSYTVLNWGTRIVEVDSVFSLGIYPTRKAATEKKETESKDKPKDKPTSSNNKKAKTPQFLFFCLKESTQDIIEGRFNATGCDRSEVLAGVAKEAYGWVNWLSENQVRFDDNSEELINKAGESLGIDSDRIPRCLNAAEPNNAIPAAQFMGGDKPCWKHIRKLDKKIYNESCPKSIKDEIEAECKAFVAKSEPYRVTTTPDDTILKLLFENGQGHWKVINDSYHQYTGNGYWRCVSDGLVQKKIADILRELYLVDRNTSEEVHCYANERNKISAFKFCRSALTHESDELFNNHLLCFRNGTVDVRTGELSQHNREDFLTSVIDSDYVRNAECPAVFKDFINNAFGEDMLPLIRALTNMYLDPTAPFSYFAHLIGESGSGKGTMIRFWGSMFDKSNVRSIRAFCDISNADKLHQLLTNVRFCTLPDVGGYVTNLKVFYELVDNGDFAGRALFSSVTYNKTWNVRFAIASVNPLTVENSADGWDRRAIELPTKNRKCARDPHLSQKLEAIKGQVVSWALGMKRFDLAKKTLKPIQCKRYKACALSGHRCGACNKHFCTIVLLCITKKHYQNADCPMW